MRTANNYLCHCVHLAQAFTQEECRRLIEIKGEKQESRIFSSEQQVLVDHTVRSAFLKPVPIHAENAWLFEKLTYLTDQANQQYFRFEYDDFSSTQIIEYPVGGFYRWHSDIGPFDNSFRKISIVVFLSDPQDYDGGQLQLHEIETNFSQEQGTLILFPSYLLHRVQPVSRGTRYSLVSWAIGSCFR